MYKKTTYLALLLALLPYTFLYTQSAYAHAFDQETTKVTKAVSVISSQLAPNADFAPVQLASQADLIARGFVIETKSFWSADRTRIESTSTLELKQRFKGESAHYVVIHTMGGFSEDEGLGMMRPHEATFAVGEDVLIFAELREDGYRLVNGAAGKYKITGSKFLDHFAGRIGSLPALLNALEDDSFTRGRDFFERGSGEALFKPTPLSNMAQLYLVTSGNRKWASPDSTVPFRVNINTQQAGRNDGSIADFRQAIQDAAMTWNSVSGANFTLQYAGSTSSTSTGYNGVNEVVFMPKGFGERGAVAQVWFRRDLTLIEADIWINDDYDWNANGTLDSQELDLQSVILHEFGHWLVLGHLADTDTVMYPKLSAGTLKRTLHHHDEQGISTIYPCDLPHCSAVNP